MFSLHTFFSNLGQKIFSKFFGFEQGVDITDDVALLVRRNIVIKNIIFLSNFMYTLILLSLSLFSQSTVASWVVTVLAFPFTFIINQILKKLIHIDKEDKTKQLVAMYVAGFYMFFSSILIYARLYEIPYYETGAYILIYYALVVISLYQDRKLLSSSFTTLIILLTAIHLLWTYNLSGQAEGYSVSEFIPIFIQSESFLDIVFRTMLFVLFYFVVYAIVSMGQYMQQERKYELMRRRQVQGDFSHIVTDLFSVVFSKSDHLLDSRHAHHVKALSLKLANDIGLTEQVRVELGQYVMIHLQYQEIKDIVGSSQQISETGYQKLKEKTELGSMIAKRLQLAQKCEDIIRAHTEGANSEVFVESMILIQPETLSQVILLCDMYVTLREVKSYNRPKNHASVMQMIEKEFHVYFEPRIIERFMKFEDEYNTIFLNF
jgi:HD-GYP domain-containing protein (c-di-GMP phosphodiesterase class II)